MNFSQLTVLAAVAFFLFLFVRSRLRQRSVTQYMPSDLAGRIGKDPSLLLLDVRTRAEYDNRHIKGALHIPLHELSSRLQELERHRQKMIVCCCQSGHRSMHAASVLHKAGYMVANLKGGMAAWNFHNLSHS